MAYAIVAFPKFEHGDFERIQRHREKHDAAHHQLIRPHFTLVFPTKGTESLFMVEAAHISERIKSFPFSIRRATVHKNEFTGQYHTFLMPGDGYSQLVHIHDELYARRLSLALRADIPYIPHVTIATQEDEKLCKELSRRWNGGRYEIRGIIDELSVLEVETQRVRKLLRLPLLGDASRD